MTRIDDGKNSREAELKRERTSLRGKIDRRHGAILSAQNEIYDYSVRLRHIETELLEYSNKRPRK